MRGSLSSFSSSSIPPRKRTGGQAALEYLSTYGFALLALLITLGVINYFGLFSPATLRSSSCAFPTGMDCHDYVINTADPGSGSAPYLRLNVVNEYGVNITLVAASMYSSTFGATTQCSLVPPPAGGVWQNGQNQTLWCPMPSGYAQGEFYSGTTTVNFTQTGGAYVHSISGRYSVIGQ